MNPPSTYEHSRAGRGEGPPENPKPATSRGTTLAMAAVALEALTGEQQALLWCVDVERDLGRRDSHEGDGYTDNRWSKTLMRLRTALDQQPWGPSECRLALVLREPVVQLEGAHSTNVTITMAIPWKVDLPSMAGGAPPVGVWRLWNNDPRLCQFTEGSKSVEDYELRHGLPEGFWTTGIPF